MLQFVYHLCEVINIPYNCRLLTGSILAHELMHGWLRLKGNHLNIHFSHFLKSYLNIN